MKSIILMSAFAILIACATTKKNEALVPTQGIKDGSVAKSQTTSVPATVHGVKVEKAKKAENVTRKSKSKVEAAADAAMPQKTVAKTENKMGVEVKCISGSDERILSKVTGQEGSCEVVYTKFGKSDTVANAKHENKYCDNAIENIQKKLVSAGFKCQ